MGSADLTSEPEEPSGIEHGNTGPAEQAATKPREMPDPGERGRVYEATRAYVEADAAERAKPGRPPDGAAQRSYWDLVPRFLEMWMDHVRRWPVKPRPASDRPADPPGSYRSRGGAYLTPERHADTAGAVDRTREAEPRISADVRAIERENKYGGWLEGFEFRLKGEDRLKEKVAEQVKAEPDKPPTEIVRKIPDAIRYTFCFESANYGRGYCDIKERLESRGYEMYYSQSSWTNPEYRGVNTRWVTQDGQRLEVQFHTPDSFHAKHHVTHAAYERIRSLATSKQERYELHAFQQEVFSWVQVPDGAADIPDLRKAGF